MKREHMKTIGTALIMVLLFVGAAFAGSYSIKTSDKTDAYLESIPDKGKAPIETTISGLIDAAVTTQQQKDASNTLLVQQRLFNALAKDCQTNVDTLKTCNSALTPLLKTIQDQQAVAVK
jgi:hypothetical protein